MVEEQAAAPIPDPVDSRSLAEIRKEALLRNFHANRASSEECMSGYLSDLANTAALRKSFEAILKDYDIKTVFDAGCGDYHWIKNVPGMEKVEYTGVDLIEEVIEANKKKTAGNANVRFVVADLANPDYVMDKAYDLVILRDVVQFQPLRDSLQMMKTIEKSGSKYIFTTFHRGTKFNNDAGYNGNMFADVMISPFNFASDAQLTAFQEHKHLDFPLNAKGMGMWPLPAMHDDPVGWLRPYLACLLSPILFLLFSFLSLFSSSL